MEPVKCDPVIGYHVFGEGDRCQCEERPKLQWEEPPTELQGCARCGRNHPIRFKLLTRPIVIGDTELTHWGTCPVVGEPVLMRLTAAAPSQD